MIRTVGATSVASSFTEGTEFSAMAASGDTSK